MGMVIGMMIIGLPLSCLIAGFLTRGIRRRKNLTKLRKGLIWVWASYALLVFFATVGAKLDFHLTDSLGRVWQCGTIQLDMNLPERFDLTYVDADGSKKRPIMLHRVIFGSIERFIGILIEHYAGAFPMWLAPQQVVIVPVHHERHLDYAKELEAMLLAKGVRVKVDGRNEKLGYRVREAQTHKIPMQIVVGDGEVENNTATVRRYGKKDSVTLGKEELLKDILNEIETKARV